MNIFEILLTQPLTNGLILFYKLLGGNLGLAIIGFSVLLRFILNPLTKPYMNSMKKMKDLQPELKKLQKKYEGDKQGLMKAQADFYKEKGVNPGAGCLPYLLQIVILIALFNVFTKVLNGDMGKLNNLLYPILKFQDGISLNSQFLWLNLSKPDVFSIPGIPFKLPGILIFFAAFIQLLSSKMMGPLNKVDEKVAKETKSQADDIQTSMQSSMTYTFPIMTLIFGVSFPAGLALYWFLFSVFQMIQQYQSGGWGGLSPWLSKLGLLKSDTSNDKRSK
jgi:YidC/Oxa1 family membrane protein insertase